MVSKELTDTACNRHNYISEITFFKKKKKRRINLILKRVYTHTLQPPNTRSTSYVLDINRELRYIVFRVRVNTGWKKKTGEKGREEEERDAMNRSQEQR